MAEAYSNDLRRKFLQAYDRGEGTVEELAMFFDVSPAWGWKILAAGERTGQMELVVGRAGRPSRVTAEIKERIQALLKQKPDLTLLELQHKLLGQAGVYFSIGRLWQLLRQWGYRLKKSHSTPPNAIPRSIKRDAKHI